MRLKTLLAAEFALAVTAGTASTALADGRWAYTHLRPDEANDRVANQNRRITKERREGELSHSQARELRVEDRGLRAQERFDARNDGHITLAQQRQLNVDENGISRQIGR